MHAHGVEFRIRIGVHTGPVAGVIGKGLRNDYTAIGKTTSVAARLLNFARPGHIAISATTRYATERAFGFSDLGSEVVEGNAEALRGYAVTHEISGSEEDYLRCLVEAPPGIHTGAASGAAATRCSRRGPACTWR